MRKVILGIVFIFVVIFCFYKLVHREVTPVYTTKEVYFFKLGKEYVEADEHFVDIYNDRFVYCRFVKDGKAYKTCDFKKEDRMVPISNMKGK